MEVLANLQSKYPMNKIIEKLPVSELYKDVLQPGLKKVGEALATVLDLSNLILLPLKLTNERSRAWFDKNMQTYQEKLDKQLEEVVPVPEYVGLPILDKLTMLNEEYLSAAFINLLTKASFQSSLGSAHPAFLSVLNNLSSDEAKILFAIKDEHHVASIDLHLIYNSDNFINNIRDDDAIQPDTKQNLKILELNDRRWVSNLTGIEKSTVLIFPNCIEMYLENLERNGIISFERKASYPYDNEVYEKLIDSTYRSEIELFYKEAEEGNKRMPGKDFRTRIVRNYFEFTAFGTMFINACINEVGEKKSVDD
jgi:hypothetical protein